MQMYRAAGDTRSSWAGGGTKRMEPKSVGLVGGQVDERVRTSKHWVVMVTAMGT